MKGSQLLYYHCYYYRTFVQDITFKMHVSRASILVRLPLSEVPLSDRVCDPDCVLCQSVAYDKEFTKEFTKRNASLYLHVSGYRVWTDLFPHTSVLPSKARHRSYGGAVKRKILQRSRSFTLEELKKGARFVYFHCDEYLMFIQEIFLKMHVGRNCSLTFINWDCNDCLLRPRPEFA
jgi:hypothetical protein